MPAHNLRILHKNSPDSFESPRRKSSEDTVGESFIHVWNSHSSVVWFTKLNQLRQDDDQISRLLGYGVSVVMEPDFALRVFQQQIDNFY